MIRDKLLTASGASGDTDIYIGEQEFLEGGFYRWRVPLSVRRIHACCIGSGDYIDFRVVSNYDGGGGGGLCWANDIEVEPGEELLIKVGYPNGGLFTDEATDSFIARPDDSDPINSPNLIKETILTAFGGKYRVGGSYDLHGNVGDGGRGGDGSDDRYLSGDRWGGSGGGAGGYKGNGGAGKLVDPWSDPGMTNGAGPNTGAAAGGCTWWRAPSGSQTGYYHGSGGGGVGVRGIGASGASVPVQPEQQTPQRGQSGSGGQGEKYGAGGANYESGWEAEIPAYAKPGGGAVRIIWGIRYSYPDNADVSQ